MQLIPRISGVTEATFLSEYVRANVPVIVTDAMDDWRQPGRWTPDHLRRKVGGMEVQVYDDLFTLVDLEDLTDYLDRNFDQPDDAVATEYVRAYVRFKDVDFTWADRLFDALAAEWGHPYFFPRSGFVLPKSETAPISPVTDLFPYKGLFISGRGARTRLHRDPFLTEAMLCQFHGEKHVVFYAPQHAGVLMRDGTFVDPDAVDRTLFPRFDEARPAYDDILRPGEILFIPSGWFHDVRTLSDSISITWNFVHEVSAERFRNAVQDPRNDFDRDVLAYLGGIA
ncbi:cupin-like domain-containing protein [Xanthomonas sp. D-109]|uniref:cupin-like domain-containing protein n=1 Tax=Xanthomonas sp. D-109 TaxID=2821274 RepID=UPI001ADD4683|nr:cupin-like domain-containing protein [Xanthomonas sp. D-109]MBO9881278.1 cupin-like domain-containing protein [Xanthomonas sp. D-109]